MMQLSHILLEQKFEAEDVLKKIKEGRPFEELARKFSRCSSAVQGGNLGDIELKRLDPDFADACVKLKAGEISPIIRTRFGYHLIKRNG